MQPSLLGHDLKTASPHEIARRFKSLITATEWAPATQMFDLVFSALVEDLYRSPRLFSYVDLFCGAGGSSIGLTMAGGQLLGAYNHSKRAVETHEKNFRGANHECVDLNHYDMRNLPKADVLWASPICTEISPAGGKKRPVKPKTQSQVGQEELLKYGAVSDDVFERTRATFHDVVRAAEVNRYRVVCVENVVDAAIEWLLFYWWIQGMEMLGYEWQILCVSAAHVGDDTNPHAAQRRDRMYVVFNLAGVPKPDLAPRPQSWCAECGLVEGVQWWKKPDGTPTASGKLLPVGKYGRSGQYLYRCPNQRCGAVVTPLERPAASIIDWSDLGSRICDRKQNGEKELVVNTLNRVMRGMKDHHRPVVTAAGGRPAELTPFMPGTEGVTATAQWTAFLDANGGSWNTGTWPINQAMRTRTTSEWEGLVTAGIDPLIDVARAHAVPQRAATHPLATVSTARHNALVVPYYRTGVAKPAASTPFPTMTTNDRCALATPELSYEITMDDVMQARYRMVKAEEAARAQRFPRFYVITGNDGERMAQAGNAVATNVAQMVGERVAEALNRTAAHV